jgi:hypothetical protein
MTANDSPAAVVAEALREGLTNAQSHGRSAVTAEHLNAEQFEMLVAATLAHLRSVPGQPAEIDGWSKVTTRDAAVVTWWAGIAALTEGERRRLGSLRSEVYDSLSERNLIERGAGRSTSLLVSPSDEAIEPEATEPEAVGTKAVGTKASGAWILKLSPYLYDVNRVFGSPDGRVHLWAVEDHLRSADMQYGDPVYLWVGEGDPYHAAGVWGVGFVAGPAVLGVPDEGWLDYQAASRASVFAVVDVTLLDAPVTIQDCLDDARLAEAEVIRDPYAPNPALLTATEAAALAECLASVDSTAERRVA